MSTLEEIQRSWHERWAPKPPKVVPSCFNRPAYVDRVYSPEFDYSYEFRMTTCCPQWLPGGNAYVRPKGDGAGGQVFPWFACTGCKWKSIKL